MIEKVLEVAYHRNGSGGEGFWAVRFRGAGIVMLAVVFEAPGHVAVFDLDLAVTTIEFMKNSWRGDRFEDGLRAAIEAHKAGR